MEINYLFVYGTLKKGQRNHHFLGDSLFVDKGEIRASLYDLGTYPGIVINKNEKNKVIGEVYKITSQKIQKEIDDLEEYIPNNQNNLYDRIFVNCLLKNNKILKAIVYVYKNVDLLVKYPLLVNGIWESSK